MTTVKRPNFFILLGLDPDAPWNQAQFEAALRQRRNEWGRQGAGVARQALAARQRLALIPEIERVMNDPGHIAEREKEAVEARIEIASGRKARYEQFEKQLNFINVKDILEEAEVNKFVDDFKDILTVKEIKDRITVRIKVPGTASTTQQKLEDTEAKNIADLLQILHLSTLYELLHLPLMTATIDLRRAAEDLYTATVGLPPTAETTATSELAGLAKKIFASEDMRKRYDETLRQISLNRLLKELDESINRTTDKIIHPRQRDLFLANAIKEGWTEQEVQERLIEQARKRKWFLQLADEPRQLCPNCETFNKIDALICIACKTPLFIECPRCDQHVSYYFIECDKCGFPVGNRILVDNKLQEIAELLRKHDLQRADLLLLEIEEAWPSKKGDERTRKKIEFRPVGSSVPGAEKIWSSTKDDERTKKRVEFKRQVDLERKQQTDLIDLLDQLIGQKKFFTANEKIIIRKLPSFPDLDTRKRSITTKIGEAQKLIQIVRTGNRTQDDKINLCRQALALCVDYKEAQELIKRMPPSSPGALRGVVRGKVVSLSWDPSSTQGVVYKIVRKSGAKPNTLTDGVLLGTVTGQTYDDDAPEMGVSLYYAVFAMLDAVASTGASYLPHPVLVVQDATKFFSQVNNRLVVLSWEPPPHVYAVIIIRNEQEPPSSLSDGVRLPHVSTSQTKLEDVKVQNGWTYYYGLYCQFKDANGTLHTSSGVFVEATPEVPPVPIASQDVSISETFLNAGREVHIRWRIPRKGDTIVLKSPRPLQKEGQVVSEAQLQTLGERLVGQADSVTDIWTGFGIAYYTPVVIFQQTAYLGTSQRYACIENVRKLSAQNLGSIIRLQWTWPQHCEEVLIAYDDGGYPNLNNPATTRYFCNRVEYDHMGYYEIQGRKDQKYYIIVAAIIEQDGEKIHALGAQAEAQLLQRTVLNYEIRNTSFLRSRRTLHITTSLSKLLPPLVLISKHNGIPMDQDDGELFERIEPPMITKDELIIELSVRKLPPQTFGMLFLEDEDAFHQEFTIHHPHKDKLRLS